MEDFKLCRLGVLGDLLRPGDLEVLFEADANGDFEGVGSRRKDGRRDSEDIVDPGRLTIAESRSCFDLGARDGWLTSTSLLKLLLGLTSLRTWPGALLRLGDGLSSGFLGLRRLCDFGIGGAGDELLADVLKEPGEVASELESEAKLEDPASELTVLELGSSRDHSDWIARPPCRLKAGRPAFLRLEAGLTSAREGSA